MSQLECQNKTKMLSKAETDTYLEHETLKAETDTSLEHL